MDCQTKKHFVLQVRSFINSLPDVREDKVENLRIQFQKNLYRPDPNAIADRMIEEPLQEILCIGRNRN